MPDDELSVSIDFEEELSKGTKKIVKELERLEAIAAGGFGKATNEAKKTEDQIQKTSGKLRVFGALLGKIGKGVALAGVAAGVFAIIGLFKLATAGVKLFVRATVQGFRLIVRASRFAVQSFLDTASGLDRIAKLAKQVGSSASELSAFRFVADLMGTSLQGIGVALRVGSKNILDYRRGVGEAADAFGKLGITQEDVNSKVKNSGDLITLVASKWENLRTDVEKTAVAQRIFGRSGSELVPILDQGVEAIEAYIAEAKKLGLVFTEAELGDVEEFNDAITRLSAVAQGLKERLVVELSPALTGMITNIIEGALALKTSLAPALVGLTNTVAIAADFIPDAFILAWKFVTEDSKQAMQVLKVVLFEAITGIGTVLVQIFITALKLIANLFIELLPTGVKVALGLLVKAMVQFLAWQSSIWARGVGFIVGFFEAGFDKIEELMKQTLNFVIRQMNWLVDQLALVDEALGGLVGVASLKIKELTVDTEKAAGVLASAKARGDEFALAVRDAGDALAEVIATPFEVSEGALKESIARAVNAAGPEIAKLFGAIVSSLSNTLDAALSGAKEASPAFAKLIEDLKARLELAKQTALVEAGVTEEIKKQAEEIAKVATALEAFGAGADIGLFGGIDEEGIKITGLLEEWQNNFALGMELARSAATGMKDIFANLFLDLTDGTLEWTQILENALLGMLDLARGLAAELLSTLLIRELLAAVEPAEEAAGTAAAAAVLTTAGATTSAQIVSGASIAGGALMAAGAVLSGQMISGATTAAAIMSSANAGFFFAKGGIMPGVMQQSANFQSFARGGVATSPTMALFSEVPGQAEAFVPLPDGRSIPVSFERSGSKAADLAGGGGRGGQGFTDARRIEIVFAPVIHAQDAAGVDDVMSRNRELLREEVLDILQNDGSARAIQTSNADFS